GGRSGPRGGAPDLLGGQRLSHRPHPQRRMARAQAAELLLQRHPRRRPAVVAVLDQLDRLGITDKTIVIFTSDHGELLNSHGGLCGKGTTAYSQQNHVPLLVVHPQFTGGQRCLETTSHLDLVPTIVAMTGKSTMPVAEIMARMKGKDLTPLLSQPVNPAFSQARGGVLFCYSQLMVHDPKFT